MLLYASRPALNSYQSACDGPELVKAAWDMMGTVNRVESVSYTMQQSARVCYMHTAFQALGHSILGWGDFVPGAELSSIWYDDCYVYY
jgi:hypothetical protein